MAGFRRDRLRTGRRCGVAAADCVERVVPVLFLQLAVALVVFWPLCLWAEAKARGGRATADDEKKAELTPLRVNLIKALVPVVPLLLLMLLGPPFNLVEVPRSWLVPILVPGRWATPRNAVLPL